VYHVAALDVAHRRHLVVELTQSVQVVAVKKVRTGGEHLGQL
jgi:hypothetical protein